MRLQIVGPVALLALSVGCDPGDASPPQQSPRSLQVNAPQNNSSELNGVELNGVELNGVELNGVELNGVELNGVELNGVELNGTVFSGTQVVDGQQVQQSGTALIGAQFHLLRDGAEFTLTFDDIYKNPADPGGDVYFYDISVYDSQDASTTPLCQHEGQPVPAIPLTNLWDPVTGDRIDNPNAVTFACTGAVLAKCVVWGYRPWATASRCDAQGQNCAAVSLADYHQACSRMTRADYCGDGTPHTLNGTLIEVYDPLSPTVQPRTMASHPGWGVEAEWGPDGALCMGESLRLQLLDDRGVAYDPPPCMAELSNLPACGEFAPERGARLASEYCTQWGTDPSQCE
jgi:uncharacterized protein YjbI with pentapeptide repeats